MSSGSSPSTFSWATGSSRDDTKGLVAVTFNEPSGLGGETATLSEPHGDVFTEDAFGNAVLSDVLVPGGIDLFFSDGDLTEALVVTPIGVDGANICNLVSPGTVYPVMAKVGTLVEHAGGGIVRRWQRFRRYRK